MNPIVVALVGNPNCGKTTLFNALTGSCQSVGNWAGVTVEQTIGQCKGTDSPIEVIDLPGCYTVETLAEAPLDERITHDYLATQTPNVIVNVVNATELERQLYLTLQLLEQRKNLVVALNMMDLAEKQGLKISVKILAASLGCPVVPITANKKVTLGLLKSTIINLENKLDSADKLDQDTLDQDKLDQTVTNQTATRNLVGNLNNIADYTNNYADNLDIVLASRRYQIIRQLIKKAVIRSKTAKINFYTERLDAIFLNKWAGIPLFLVIMYWVFVFTIQIGGTVQEVFEVFLQQIFVDGLRQALKNLPVPEFVVILATNGLGQGIMTTLSFIPVIACMFFCLSFLEASGYMARAAFVMDKIMQWLGLSGKSFVPMILGFGCNVPAILGARTLENVQERLLTIMMTPFMSCGARLAIYALFVSAFFKTEGHNIIFILYIIGLLAALLTGWIVRSAMPLKSQAHLILELPPYYWPNLKRVCKTTWHRLQRFLVKAGVVIVPLCILLSSLCAFNSASGEPWLIYIGRNLTPLFEPMGIESTNWPATVGLLTGILAKEVVVGSLNSLYSIDSVGIGAMVAQFGGASNAFAYLLFVLLYFPCVSVLATIAKELNFGFAFFSAFWTTTLAYTLAVIFYQTANFNLHPLSSLMWILAMLGFLGISFYLMRKWVEANTFQLNGKKAMPIPTQVLILDRH